MSMTPTKTNTTQKTGKLKPKHNQQSSKSHKKNVIQIPSKNRKKFRSYDMQKQQGLW